MLHGLEVEMFSHPSGAVECDTFWNITDADSGLFVECYYNTDLFAGQTIRRWLGHYQAMLAGLITNPCQHLVQLPLLTEAEQQRLLSAWNDREASH